MQLAMIALPVLVAAADPVESANTFALELYREVVSGDDNAFLSPYSVSSAFAMVLAATDGPTRDQIASTMGLDADDVHRVRGEMQERVNETGEAGAFDLRVANRLWGHAGVPAGYYGQPCLDLMAKHYGAGWETVNFGNPDAARGTINAWVATQTNDRIPELIPAGVLDDLSRLVITNTVYFKAAWAHPFMAGGTRPGPFQTTTGSVQADTMSTTAAFATVERDGVRVMKLPYLEGSASMVVLMPTTIDLPTLERQLTVPRLAAWLEAATAQQLSLSFPRFELRSSYPLHESVLSRMGVTAPFQTSLDWTPLNGDREPLRISAVLHDAFVKVDEQGTEAAAATGVSIVATSFPGSVAIDRSFVFLIVHEPTGLILFTGRVVDPTRRS